MGQKKQHGTLHHVHTRIPEKEYQKIKPSLPALALVKYEACLEPELRTTSMTIHMLM